MERFTGILGVLVLLAIAWAMSSARRRVDWKLMIGGVVVQAALAYLVLAFPPVVLAFDVLAEAINTVISAADSGIEFMFGPLGDASREWGFIFFVQALPIIIFFSSLMAVLYHAGIMQRLIAALAWTLRRTLGVTGTEALVVAANVFVGQTEAPLCVRPYLPKITRSQLMTLMVGGFATIAGSVLAAYVGLLGEEFTRHFIAASAMSAPAAFVFAKILEPETAEPLDGGLKATWGQERAGNILDAAAAGTHDGLRLAVNVAAMLIAFVSLLRLVNLGIGGYAVIPGVPELSAQMIMGWVLSPLAVLLGAPLSDAQVFGALLGEKIILTEFVAYASLADLKAEAGAISDRTAVIATYALCGFANIPSIAIQIGGLTALVPSRRAEIVELGVRAMIGGAFASWSTAAIAGVFLPLV